MQTAIYVIWGLIPLFFFGSALWSKLEQLSNKTKRENPGDFFHQGLFISGCVIVALIVDHLFIESIANSIDPELIPPNFYRVILLPLLLAIGAKVIGGSKEILISKAPRGARRKR